MIQVIFTVFDKPADTFLPFFACTNEDVAVRSFCNSFQEKEHPFSINPFDYDLYHLGSYDTETGIIENIGPILFMTGRDAHLKSKEAADAL